MLILLATVLLFVYSLNFLVFSMMKSEVKGWELAWVGDLREFKERSVSSFLPFFKFFLSCCKFEWLYSLCFTIIFATSYTIGLNLWAVLSSIETCSSKYIRSDLFSFSRSKLVGPSPSIPGNKSLKWAPSVSPFAMTSWATYSLFLASLIFWL